MQCANLLWGTASTSIISRATGTLLTLGCVPLGREKDTAERYSPQHACEHHATVHVVIDMQLRSIDHIHSVNNLVHHTHICCEAFCLYYARSL